MMDCKLSVQRCGQSIVRPCEKTPWGTLRLSPIDSLVVLRCNARTLHVFKVNKDGPVGVKVEVEVAAPPPAAVIREALSRALVHYYPLAGRLIINNHHDRPLELDCSSQGILFVEASSTNTLASLNYLDDLTFVPFHLLLPEQQEHESDALVQMQVTQFACGGFVIGLIFCHSICDGLGAAQFLNAVGELARGIDSAPTLTPTWHRDFCPPRLLTLRNQGRPAPPPPEYRLGQSNIDIPIDRINRLKKQFQESTGGTICSAFEMVAACFWRSRTRAVYEGAPNNEEIKLVFFANCRQLVEPPLPNGFYGNCFFPVRISGWSRGIGEASINEVVKVIQEAKSRVGREFGKYITTDHKEEEEEEDHPFAPPLNYSTLFISEWGRLGFNQVDYGWGPPVHVVPIQGSAVIPVGILGSLPLPKKGIRLMTWCVEERHRPSFLYQISQLL